MFPENSSVVRTIDTQTMPVLNHLLISSTTVDIYYIRLLWSSHNKTTVHCGIGSFFFVPLHLEN